MSYFPMFVDLEGKHVLAVGAGTIGSRRILTLLKFGAQVTAVDPDGRKLKEMEGWNGLSWIREPYEAYRTRLLEKAPDFFMVLTATGNRETDLLAVSDGRRMGAFVNAAADRFLSDFYFPGIACAGSVTAGVTTGGEDHRLAKRACEEVRAFLTEWEESWREQARIADKTEKKEESRADER